MDADSKLRDVIISCCSDLQRKYPGHTVSIDITGYKFPNNAVEVEYSLYISSKVTESFNSMDYLLQRAYELIAPEEEPKQWINRIKGVTSEIPW